MQIVRAIENTVRGAPVRLLVLLPRLKHSLEFFCKMNKTLAVDITLVGKSVRSFHKVHIYRVLKKAALVTQTEKQIKLSHTRWAWINSRQQGSTALAHTMYSGPSTFGFVNLKAAAAPQISQVVNEIVSAFFII